MNPKYLFALFFCLCLLASCNNMTNAKGLADPVIIDFHRQFNEQKFKELYASAHPDLRTSVTEGDFLKLLDAVNRKLGKHVRSTDASWRVGTFNMKTTAVVSQNTEFEMGKGVETFTLSVSGGSCTLLRYQINSQDMMTK